MTGPVDDTTPECPACGDQWSYTGADGRELTNLISIYSQELDRTVAWRCPGCGTRWERT